MHHGRNGRAVAIRIIGCLIFFDESPTWLSASIASFTKLGMTDLVAVDGAYELYPDGQRKSGSEQHAAIYEISAALGIGTLLYVPPRLWVDEVEKRNCSLALAEQLVEDPERDFYVRFDADEFVTDVDINVTKVLRKTPHDVASITLWERYDPFAPGEPGMNSTHARVTAQDIQVFFRAIPGLRLAGNHYTYRTPDGRNLWGNKHNLEIEEVEHLRGARVEHRTNLRDSPRHLQKRIYYQRREQAGYERDSCAFCDEDSICALPWAWTLGDNEMLNNDNIEVCGAHVAKVLDTGKRELAALGQDVGPFERMVRFKVGVLGHDHEALLGPYQGPVVS